MGSKTYLIEEELLRKLLQDSNDLHALENYQLELWENYLPALKTYYGDEDDLDKLTQKIIDAELHDFDEYIGENMSENLPTTTEIKTYGSVNNLQKELVNKLKEAELDINKIIREVDTLMHDALTTQGMPTYVKRMQFEQFTMQGKLRMIEAFMWLNRAIFQPNDGSDCND